MSIIFKVDDTTYRDGTLERVDFAEKVRRVIEVALNLGECRMQSFIMAYMEGMIGESQFRSAAAEFVNEAIAQVAEMGVRDWDKETRHAVTRKASEDLNLVWPDEEPVCVDAV